MAKMADYLHNTSISELDDSEISSTALLETIQQDLNSMKNLATISEMKQMQMVILE